MNKYDNLELNKILNKVSEYATLDETKEAILNIELENNNDVISLMQDETFEALNMIYRLSSIDLEYFDFLESLNRLRVSSLLSVHEFLELKKLIYDSNKLISAYNKCKNEDNNSLSLHFENIKDLKPLNKEIDNIIDFEGEIVDTASDELYRIRKEIKAKEKAIVSKLNEIVRAKRDILADEIITLRSGHHVIPVKVEYKNSIKGMIYDESSSGNTVFIEPFIIQTLESEMILLKGEEKKEIDKIMYRLSGLASSYYLDILSSYNAIIDIDKILSKAMYAKEINGTKVIISDSIKLLDARHPLIDKDKVVSNDIIIDKKMMIITGPNTGGKTVILKTVGLLSLMVKCGLLLPVKEGSTIKIFNEIYADIGDEQSIEQNLSTFSSHMKRIVDIIDNHVDNSLILFDELGSGTDPKEGASLAISILSYLLNDNCVVIATTHYPELKSFAYSSEEILNASVLFDANSLMPTFKLLIGTSGMSNAYLISKRLGLREDIIENAKSFNFEFNDVNSEVIKRLEKESIELNNRNEEVIKLKDNLKSEINHYKELIGSVKDKEKKALSDIENKKNKILEDAQKKANELIEDIKKVSSDIKLNILSDLKGRTNKLIDEKEIPKSNSNKELKIGDTVNILKFDTTGEIVDIKNNKYVVMLGSMKSNFKREDLEYIKVKKNKDEVINTLSMNKVFNTSASSRLDIRGMRYEEAKDALDKFISDSIYFNLDNVTIIHGFGSLVLREMVIEYCKNNNLIKKYRSGEENEGGRGVTVIYL